MDIFAVEAYTASWIEMPAMNALRKPADVEAYTASWIEISYHIAPAFSFPSKPIRLRGLKSEQT